MFRWVWVENILSIHAGDFLVVLLHLETNPNVSLCLTSQIPRLKLSVSQQFIGRSWSLPASVTSLSPPLARPRSSARPPWCLVWSPVQTDFHEARPLPALSASEPAPAHRIFLLRATCYNWWSYSLSMTYKRFINAVQIVWDPSKSECELCEPWE